MDDLFQTAEDVAPKAAAAAPPANPRRRIGGMSLREMIFLVAAIFLVLWGAWVTKNVISDEGSDHQFVQLQLQGIIGEYLQAQARSTATEQEAAHQTAVFMATLDETVEGLSSSGKIILVNQAVIGGDIPDVTESVKAAVYSKVPRPQTALSSPDMQQSQSARVQNEMQAFMASSEGANPTGGGRVQR